MKNIAVIGSNSFSGSHFVNRLLENPDYNVIGISRSPESNQIFLPYQEKESKNFKFYQMDLNQDLEEIIGLLDKEKIGYIVNYAAQGMVGQSWKNPEHWFQTNCNGIVKFANKIKDLSCLEKYVHISTNEVYGPSCNITENAPLNPSTPYASSKAAGDMFIQNLIKEYNFPAEIVRSTNVYGPGQQLFRIIPRSIIYLKIGKKIDLQGGGDAVKSYLHIKDNCDATLKIMESGVSGQVYHISPNESISIKNVVNKICDLTGKNFDECVNIVEERAGQDKESNINSDKIRKELNWTPKIKLEKGLEECIDWVDKNWEIIKTQPSEYIHKK